MVKAELPGSQFPEGRESRGAITLATKMGTARPWLLREGQECPKPTDVQEFCPFVSTVTKIFYVLEDGKLKGSHCVKVILRPNLSA